MRRKAVVYVLVVFLLGFLTIRMAAQLNSCKVSVVCFNNSQWYAVCVPPLPPGAYDCTGFDFTEYCSVPLYECPPSPCPTCNGATGGGPIEFSTGNTDVRQSDVVLPGLGGGLTLTRRWNSTPGIYSNGMFGHQWSSNFEEQVFIGGDHMIKHLRGDGSLWTYGFANYWGPTGDTPTFLNAAPRNGGATLVYYYPSPGVSVPYWILTFKNGERRVFSGTPPNTSPDQIFYLSSITDRNGNTTGLSRDSSNRVTAVTDAASRHLYFAYASAVSPGLVTGVTSDFGVSLSYQYDAFANLVKVTKPDGTFVSFEYSPAGLLTAVKDTSGKILEAHTYDGFGRGLTSSRAGGVDSVTVSY